MSWQLASFAIVVAVILVGFGWYERSRPPSQVVALVAALAALAIAGRIAFAAFPNVKPTTDIVIFAGYALGGAAGFAVGALTALVSNFWFGQGPWTPWQMAGWGICGLMGAGLALGGRNVGRLTLAGFCGAAAIVYGALLNFSLMATYGGDLTFKHFLVLEARGIPFEAAHAIGNITFALIAGPAMIRMLVRFRERFEWHVPRSAAVASLLMALALVATLPARANASASTAVSWLVSVQNSDGGFAGTPGDESSPDTTGWAMLGLEAAGRNPLDVSRSGNTPVNYLRSKVGELSSAGDLARTILALEGAGVDPHSFGGRDLVTALANRRRDDGSWEGWPGVTSYAIIAMRAAGATGGLDKSQSWLAGAQDADGGWGNAPNSNSSSADVTGQAMQAIPNTKAAQGGLKYLRNHQSGSGGFALGGGGSVNAQSTAWAAQGMIAVGADAGAALNYMAGLQDADGHYRYSGSSNQTPIFVTGQVLVPISGQAFPVSVAPRAPKPPTPTTTTTAPSTVPATPVTPVPIPGVDSLPGTPTVPSAPTQSAAPPGTTTAPTTGGSGPLVPEAGIAAPPSATGEPEPEGTVLAEAAPASSVESDSPSPWVPIGIGLGITALAVALPLLLGKRFAW